LSGWRSEGNGEWVGGWEGRNGRADRLADAAWTDSLTDCLPLLCALFNDRKSYS